MARLKSRGKSGSWKSAHETPRAGAKFFLPPLAASTSEHKSSCWQLRALWFAGGGGKEATGAGTAGGLTAPCTSERALHSCRQHCREPSKMSIFGNSHWESWTLVRHIFPHQELERYWQDTIYNSTHFDWLHFHPILPFQSLRNLSIKL